MAGKARANGEGSIYPHRNGYAAYVWVTTPIGTKTRKYVYGPDRETVHAKWLKLHQAATAGPVATKVPKVGAYALRWLEKVIRPNSAPMTYATTETLVRLYLAPGLGHLALTKLTVANVQAWLNKVATTCQCCSQGKDARRKIGRQKCCAVGACCGDYLGARSLTDVRATLRNLVNHAMVEELLSKNVVSLTKVPKPKRRPSRKPRRWSTEQARRFLASAREDGDPMFVAYVLVLLLAMRKGEVLGLPVGSVDLDGKVLDVAWQLQRVRGELLHRETKTAASDDTLPLPTVVTAAVSAHLAKRAEDEGRAGSAWQESGLLLTTRYGTPIEPRNFNRSWDVRCAKAGVPKITVHDGRRSCASLLADMDVHPSVIMRILRHANMKITMELYTEVSDDRIRAALSKLSDDFG